MPLSYQLYGLEGDVKKLGKLHRRDEFIVWHGKPKGRSKPRMVFLFDEMLMFTKVKRINETTKRDHNKDPIAGYVYKSHIAIPGIEVARPQELNGDDRKFEVLNEKPNFMHRTLQGANSYVIRAWEKEISDLAETAQLEGRKPFLVKNRTHSLIRRSSNRGSVHSIGSSQRSKSLSSFNSSETGSIGAPSIASSNRSSDLSVFTPDTASNRSSFISYVSNADQDVTKHSNEAGNLFEITHNVVAQGVEGLEFSKGDIVKVIKVCEDDSTFHIQTIPTESFPYTKDGYIAREYLKKIEETVPMQQGKA
ncbi:uncharacterized protein [Amphiura filiformis]|uniref:uncharacterized protein n=1 Tax=Amphiura filiformis TaxID=82378 RepID=UPI003B21299C